MRVHRVVMSGVWVVLGLFLLVLAAVRLGQGRFRDAAFTSMFAIVSVAMAAFSEWLHRRQQTRTPHWTRGVPAEVLADPRRRFEVYRHTRQARALPWIFLLIGLGSIAWAVTLGRWVVLIASVAVLISSLRLMQRIYFPGDKRPE